MKLLRQFQILIPHFSKYWRIYSLFSLLTLFVTLFDLGILAIGGKFIDFFMKSTTVLSIAWKWIAVLLSLFLIVEVVRGWQNYLISTLSLRLNLGLQNKLVHKILFTSFKYFKSKNAGTFIKRIFRDAEQVSEFISSFALVCLRYPFRIVLFSVVLIYFSFKLFLVFSLLLLQAGLISVLVARALNKLYFKMDYQEGVIYQKLQKLLSHWFLIKSSQMEQAESVSWDKENETYYQLQASSYLWALCQEGAFRVFLFLLVLVLWGYYQVTGFSVFESPGVWAQVFGLTLLWMHSIQGMAEALVDLLDEKVRAKKVVEILNWPEEKRVKGVVPKQSQLERIELKDISFSYGRSKDLYKGLKYCFNGEKPTLITGPNGSGKTTLAYLMLGFFDPKKGGIHYNQVAHDQIDLAWFRNRSGIVYQSPYLLEASLSDNLLYGLNGNSHRRITEALQFVGLDHLLNWQKTGKFVGESFRDLSFGEKQKLALARAYLHNPDLLILDEATSGLDKESEERILKELFQLRKGKITVVISHKMRLNKSMFYHLELGCVSKRADRSRSSKRASTKRK